ncbi:MAG: hypothetical protein ACRDZ6_10560 [Acidimicrobiales bacterium]
MRRAAGLLEGYPEWADAELGLVEALALAGRVDEAVAAGGRLVTRLADGSHTIGLRVQAHLQLGRAAVAGSRWEMARYQLDSARSLAEGAAPAEVATGIAVLEAEVLIAGDDYEAARRLAEGAVRAEGASAQTRCNAWEIIGRTRRLFDLAQARGAFEQALITAEAADLPLWRLRALHELGTIDLFDHVGVDRLLQARGVAEQLGALSTVAVLDLQLGAAYTCRWELDGCDAHARSALVLGERLGLELVRAKALAGLAGSASMRADVSGTERYSTLARAAAPEDKMLEGFLMGSLGLALLLAGKGEAAIESYAAGMTVLGRLAHAEPFALRALWPLVLAARGDRRAEAAIGEARRLGVADFNLNRGMVGYADAILAGRGGDTHRARDLAGLADGCFPNSGA